MYVIFRQWLWEENVLAALTDGKSSVEDLIRDGTTVSESTSDRAKAVAQAGGEIG